MRLYLAVARWFVFVLFPLSASALGLGEIRLNSFLNQPFSADIPLESAESSELLELEVRLASPETFDRYGLDRPAYLGDFSFDVQRDTNGNPVIHLSSGQPVSEPFVTMLLDVTWPAGRLLREYTVLLDPPLFEKEAVQSEIAPAQVTQPTESRVSGQVERVTDMPEAQPTEAPSYEDSAVVESTGLFQAEQSAEQPAQQAPAATGSAATATVSEPPAQPAASGAAVAATTGSYTTRRGDTLWSIAERVRGSAGLTNNQMMLALYRANPDAFLGNINALKAGAILRVPPGDEVSAPTVSEANNVVKQQIDSWQGVAPAQAEQPRLQLVAPGEAEQPTASVGGTGVAVGDAAAATGELQERIGELESQLSESQRLLQVRDAELEALQQRIAELEQTAAEPGDLPAEVEVEVVEEEALDSEQVFVDEAEAIDESAVDVPAETAEEALEQPADAPEVVATDPAAEEGGLFSNMWLWIGIALALLAAFLFTRRRKTDESLADTSGTWADDMVPAVAEDETLKDFGDLQAREAPVIVEESDLEDAEPHIADADATLDDQSLRDAVAEADDLGDLGDELAFPAEAADEVGFEELGDEAPAVSADTGDTELPLEKTISTGAPLNLDQADPIAEAEFHMAYGLYDQAADLLVSALDNEPENRAYRVKLIEVYFVWENKDGFLEQARALHESIEDASDSDWSKVLILGKQLCPDEELFTGVAAPTGSMDLELGEAGETSIDFDVGGDGSDLLDVDLGLPDADPDAEDITADLDFDLGDGDADTKSSEIDLTLRLDQKDSVIGPDDATMESPTVDVMAMDSDDIDIGSEDATMESPTVDVDFADFNADGEGATMESPTLESPLVDDDSASTMETPTVESPMMEPTLESPTLDVFGGDGGETSEMPMFESSEEATDEEPADPTSLDVDLSGLTDLPVEADELLSPEGSDAADNEDIFSSLSAEDVSDESSDELQQDDAEIGMPTFDDDESRLSPETENLRVGDEGETVFASLEELGKVAADSDNTAFEPESEPVDSALDELADADDADGGFAIGDTAEQPSFEAQVDGDTAVQEQPATELSAGDTNEQPVLAEEGALDLDLDLAGESEAAEEISVPDDATMTEVGTKLDLARAYIDMGDPDGARSILEEVLDEGGDSAQQEARQLLDELSD